MLRTLLAGAVCVAATAPAAFALPDDVEITGNIAYVNDYRFRGVSLSDEQFAIQGGFDVALPNGFSAGVWASTIDNFAIEPEETGDPTEFGSEVEVDIYGEYAFQAGPVDWGFGAIYYAYPGNDVDAEYYELFGSATTTLGPTEGTFGVAYAPEQDNLGDDDNTYIFVSTDTPLGETPFSLGVGLGWEDGAFGDPDGDGDEKLDWIISLSTEWEGLGFSLAYIDTSEDGENLEETVVFTVSKEL